MYKVVKFFTDLQDNKHAYNVGDTFPRAGLDVSEKRLAELSSSKNRQGKPLIKKVDEPKAEPKAELKVETKAENVEPTHKPKKKGQKKHDDK